MKNWIKTSIAAAIIATSAIGVSAVARGGDCDGMRDGRPGAQQMSPEKMKARMAQRGEVQAAKLELALALTPAQKPAWDDFKAALKARGERMVEQMTARSDAERPTTVLDRMAKMEEMSKLRQAEMAEMRKAVEVFYAQLSDAQKTVFDAEFDRMGGRHGARDHKMGKGKPDGMGAGRN
jgi:hypothetical protein